MREETTLALEKQGSLPHPWNQGKIALLNPEVIFLHKYFTRQTCTFPRKSTSVKNYCLTERQNHHPFSPSELKRDLLTYSKASIDETAQEGGGGEQDQLWLCLNQFHMPQEPLAVFYFLL